ncbi:serine/threonine-protein kinase [Streptantibioticus silvisoli]|uniref:Serine/threonine-protein kinase n=1 Tax=Streptantibioticus silvisoli TaxID=2705255 RepID=A0ABT6W2M8_9ACTN|nr:serine/threonine-protein kinase [Streptantibioticus silvisoli]MDI5964549.1 serine/threonine-protein kinase [Streptantibioticus silvisoli]
MSRDARLTAHGAVSTSLALCSDRTLGELVDTAVPLGSGIGGTSALLEVAGTPVFVKRVPLTDLETQPQHVRSTANLFELPVFCQYGIGEIGGPGGGAWRELAVHTMTTNWVLAAEYDGFPLMYHWRVLPDSTPLPGELADVERAVAYWGGGPQVRRRIEARRQSPASVALFLEYIPQNLHQWLNSRVGAGDETADRACAMVERELAAGTSFMNSRGLLHFDAHFENILTDGRRLYFTDYGLSLSSRFELSQDEADFFDRHQVYDRCYTTTYLVNWLVTALYGHRVEDWAGRYERVRAYADGERPTGIPEKTAAIIARHAPVAAVVSDFNSRFRRRSRQTSYPLEEIRRLGGMDASALR